MKKLIAKIEGAHSLSKKEQQLINGANNPVAICDAFGNCPPGTFCDGGLCYPENSGNPPGGGGTPPGGCDEPLRICQEWETGCGCVN